MLSSTTSVIELCFFIIPIGRTFFTRFLVSLEAAVLKLLMHCLMSNAAKENNLYHEYFLYLQAKINLSFHHHQKHSIKMEFIYRWEPMTQRLLQIILECSMSKIIVQ